MGIIVNLSYRVLSIKWVKYVMQCSRLLSEYSVNVSCYLSATVYFTAITGKGSSGDKLEAVSGEAVRVGASPGALGYVTRGGAGRAGSLVLLLHCPGGK